MTSVAAMANLLRAGVPSGKVWQLSQTALEALSDKDRQELELVWGFANRVGAPLSEALAQFHALEQDRARTRRELEQAQAVPAATRKLLLWLPLVSLGFAQLAGFQVIIGLTHPLGLTAAALAGLLIWLGARWSKRYLESTPEPRGESLALITMQLGLRAGLGVSAAREAAAAELSRRGIEVDFSPCQELLALSAETGAALADLLLARAVELREQAAVTALTAAQRAAVKLLVPLGLTTLPAFLLLTLTPIFISLINK
jgi:tight adherence protein B